jgi:hypothetical protein
MVVTQDGTDASRPRAEDSIVVAIARGHATGSGAHSSLRPKSPCAAALWRYLTDEEEEGAMGFIDKLKSGAEELKHKVEAARAHAPESAKSKSEDLRKQAEEGVAKARAKGEDIKAKAEEKTTELKEKVERKGS